jgi:ribosome-binding protein aMBF1 (putative translation factor)
MKERFVTKRLLSTSEKMIVDREVRRSYDSIADEFDLARELMAARARAGLIQAELAQRMSTTQSVVARLGSGARLSSVKTLLRFEIATGAQTDHQIAGRLNVSDLA